MSRFTLFRRLAAAAPALVAACALATPASAADLSLDYKCEWPLIGKRLTTVDYSTAVPSEWPANTASPPWAITVDATGKEQSRTLLQLTNTATLEGEAVLQLTVAAPGEPPKTVDVKLPIARTDAATSDPTELGMLAEGALPTLVFAAAGEAKITVDSLRYSLIAREADGTVNTTFSQIQPGPAPDIDIETFDVYCNLDGVGQDTTLRELTITDTPICPPGWSGVDDPCAPSLWTAVSDVTATGVRAQWAAGGEAWVEYEVYLNGQLVGRVSGSIREYRLEGLAPNTQHAVKVVGIRGDGTRQEGLSTSFRTEPGATMPIVYALDLSGSTVLRNLTRGTLPLRGSLSAKLQLETQQFEADLTLEPTKGTLKALNFLPVRATVSFTQAAKTTGAIAAGGAVTSKSLVNIRLSSVNVFGIPLVAGNCRTQKPSEINLKSQPGFDLLAGGRMTGSYAISNLIDCGPLTILVSPLTAGSGNTITVDLANGQAPAAN